MNSTPKTIGVDPKGEVGKTKAPMGLLPLGALEEVAWALGDGAKKYGEWNWRATSVCSSTYLSAILRHLSAYQAHEDRAQDSGRKHLAHIVASCLILMDAEQYGRLVEDHAPLPPAPSELH